MAAATASARDANIEVKYFMAWFAGTHVASMIRWLTYGYTRSLAHIWLHSLAGSHMATLARWLTYGYTRSLTHIWLHSLAGSHMATLARWLT